MTRKNKKYQLLISTLLLCFLQMAGIDVYAQAPVTPVQKDTTITHREPPKARARRHRDPMQEQDSLRKDSIVLPPKHLQSIDSLSAAKIQVADSLDAANKKELKKIEQPAAIVVNTDTVPPPSQDINKKIFVPNPTRAAGGGYAQVLPMDKINLHFTGDFHAITSAHNMISALLDNYLYQNQAKGFGLKEILWRRVLDVNDRSLRSIVVGLGPKSNGITQESGFDITPASEIMAILCLAQDVNDLRRRIENILLGFTYDDQPFTVKDLGVAGAITVLLKDAIHPNLVQTTEGTAAFVHGGPFANIAHGCNSILATKLAMTFGDYVITEAGFGADLGAEKFYNIKCRKSGLQPRLTVIVATAQGLKMHGGVSLDRIKEPNMDGLKEGLRNLDKHVRNLRSFGQTVVVAFNKFASDTEEEMELLREHCEQLGVGFAINNAFSEGGEGAVDMARLVVDMIENNPSEPLTFTYKEEDSIQQKIEKVATHIYGASVITYSSIARNRIKLIEKMGITHYPVCIAKTQYSFSADPKIYGAVNNFEFHIKDIVINNGAEMIVAIAGEILRMPGLPKEPQALHIDIVDGEIEGLS